MSRKRERRLANALEYAAVRGLDALLGLLPEPLLDAAARRLGELAYGLDRRHRRVGRENLRLAFGTAVPPGRRRAILKGHFRHLGLCLAELLQSRRLDRGGLERRIEAEGAGHLDEALAGGRGALLVSAHLGNWELMGLWVSARGYPIHSVARRQDNPRLNDWLERRRTRRGQVIHYKKGALRVMLDALSQGGLVCILIDQNERQEPLYVDFFGHPASVNRSAATIAARTGAPIVMVENRRIGGGRPEGRIFRHRLRFEPPIRAREDLPRKEAIQDLARRMTKTIETWVADRPEQWLWTHRRWKTQPEE